MKQINNQTPTVHLSTYDNSGKYYPVDKKYKDIENICVAVIFGDTIIKISSKELCECDFNEALARHSEELMSPVFWQIIGVVQTDVAKALKMLGHDELKSSWAYSEYFSYHAWFYHGHYGSMNGIYKNYSRSVRPAQAFQL